jgi:hypothetical protein
MEESLALVHMDCVPDIPRGELLSADSQLFFSRNFCAYCEITGNQAKSVWSYMFCGCESLNHMEDPIATDILARVLWGISLCNRRFLIR